MQETEGMTEGMGLIPSWEDLLEEEMATHSSVAWNSMDRGAWRATVRGVAESDMTEVT